METTKEIEKYLAFQQKLKVLLLASKLNSCKQAYELYGISRSTFYSWKRKYKKDGEKGLVRKKVDPESIPNRTPTRAVKLILQLREDDKLGTWRIKWYLERYHDINISESTVYRTLKRNNIKSLDKTITRRALATKRYEKETPGHHVQVDVKFLIFFDHGGKKIKRYQNTAIDNCTRIRAIKVYEKHNQLAQLIF